MKEVFKSKINNSTLILQHNIFTGCKKIYIDDLLILKRGLHLFEKRNNIDLFVDDNMYRIQIIPKFCSFGFTYKVEDCHGGELPLIVDTVERSDDLILGEHV